MASINNRHHARTGTFTSAITIPSNSPLMTGAATANNPFASMTGAATANMPRRAMDDDMMDALLQQVIADTAIPQPIIRINPDPLVPKNGHQLHYVRKSRSMENSWAHVRSAANAYSLMQDIIHSFYELPSRYNKYRLQDRTSKMHISRSSFNSMTIYVNDIPAILLVDIGKTILLETIYGSPTAEHGKLKRLILRHMGFNCVRYSNSDLLRLDDGSIFRIKKTETFVASTSRRSPLNFRIYSPDAGHAPEGTCE